MKVHITRLVIYPFITATLSVLMFESIMDNIFFGGVAGSIINSLSFLGVSDELTFAFYMFFFGYTYGILSRFIKVRDMKNVVIMFFVLLIKVSIIIMVAHYFFFLYLIELAVILYQLIKKQKQKKGVIDYGKSKERETAKTVSKV